MTSFALPAAVPDSAFLVAAYSVHVQHSGFKGNFKDQFSVTLLSEILFYP